ncbi:MAG TPA: hypothetical protein VMR77_03825 [Patescibacteria group bacterium]|jgi:hypothetical protein|nr:hypothetical protein [Patescibacteria group bacterium]
MAKTERLSDQLIEIIASRAHPQGKAFAEFKPGGHGRVIFGKKHGGLNVEREGAASPTIGSLRLEDRRDIISKCKKPLNVAAEATSVLAGAIVLDGAVRNRSARRVAIGLLSGVAVWMGARVVVEICDQTINSLNERIVLLDKMVRPTPQEQPHQRP